MGPGGSHGLQNRSRPDHVGLGGFDSHALPPSRCLEPWVGTDLSRVVMRILKIQLFGRACACVCVAVSALALPATLVAQRPAPRPAPVVPPQTNFDSLKPPITPRRAFAYSFFLPGSAQSILGRHKAGATFILIEAITLGMIRESAADVHEARRLATDSVVFAYVDANGGAAVQKVAPKFDANYVHTRQAHVEDWIALLVANHLFAGADGFVAAHLWDVPARLAIRALPRGGTLALSVTW